MNKHFKYKISLFLVLYMMILYMDYKYHTFLTETSFGNYAWLGYFRYNAKNDLIYSWDVIIGTITFFIIFIGAIVKRDIKNHMFLVFPILYFLVHIITMK